MLKLLSFAYWQFRALARAIRDDGYDDFKALGMLCIFEGLLIVTMIGTVSLVIHKNLFVALAGRLGALVLVAVGGASVVLNYYLLDTAAEFEPEFKHYSSETRLLGRIALFFIALLLVIGAFSLVGPVRKL